MSSGLVSGRTRITGPFAAASATALRLEDSETGGGAGRGVQALAEQTAALDRLLLARLVEAREQELGEVVRGYTIKGLIFADEALADHLHRHAYRRNRVALRRAGLEHVQLRVLDRELDVLRVAEVLFELLA